MNIRTTNKLIDEILSRKMGFLGTGQIGGVLIKSFTNFLTQNYQEAYKVDFKDYFYMYDPSKKDYMTSIGYKHSMNNEAEVFRNSKIIFNCVKPDVVQGLFLGNRNEVTEDHLIVSIAAGIGIDYMEKLFKVNNVKPVMPKIVRSMTNHLCSINTSGSVYTLNSKCNELDEEIVKTLLLSLGIVKKIYENQMNAFTALTGSGPAFVYHFIESLVDASIKNGIDVNTAREFAIQTVFGAAKYLKEEKDKNPNTHQYIVATPKGTTIEGLSQLNKHKVKHAMIEAITCATKRGEQIEKEKNKLLKKWIKENTGKL